MRVVGVDPGTKSFDVVALEGGRVVSEASLDTPLVAREPQALVDAIVGLDPDLVVAPSGYGVPVTFGDEVVDPRRLAVEVLLLSTEEDISRGVSSGELGVWVYDALAKVVVSLVSRYGGRVVFLPGVVHLTTVPRYRKLNKVDMGTVDKLASAFLAIHELGAVHGDYSRVNAVVVEAGYGYVASIAVEGGRIVDGIGGTYASVGTLTAGALDLEVVAGSKTWERWDVFHGGLLYATGAPAPDDLASGGDWPGESPLRAYVEGVAKDIRRASVSSPKADVVVLTGRFGRNPTLLKLLREALEDYEVVTLRGLRGVSSAKEAAQGYAAIGMGLAGGEFKELVEHVGIREACGTSVDYVTHPRARGFVERVRRAYEESVLRPKRC